LDRAYSVRSYALTFVFGLTLGLLAGVSKSWNRPV
jgi:hypothetical protein